MARRSRSKHHSPPLSTRYDVRVQRPASRKRRQGPSRVYRDASTQKREAIRSSHRLMGVVGQGARCEVRTKEGQLVYQAHLSVISGRWRIVTEEL